MIMMMMMISSAQGVTAQLCDEVILTRKDLEDGGEEEASALDQSEELIQKGNEGEEAEEYGEDHEGLDRLDPVWKTHGNHGERDTA